jgi:hypothetical protein
MCPCDPIGTPATTFSASFFLVLLCLCALGVGMRTQQTLEVIHMNKMLGKQGTGRGRQHMFHMNLCRNTSRGNGNYLNCYELKIRGYMIITHS